MLFLENILTQETIQKLGWTLLHFAWQAAAVALLLAIMLRVLRKSTANLRYIIACLALGLVVLLPIVTMPLVPVAMPYSATNIEPVRPLPVSLTGETKEIPVAEMPAFEEPVQPEKAGTDFVVLAKQRAAELLEPALPYIVSGWLLGVFGLSLWHLGGWTQLQRLRRKMVKQVDQTLLSKLSQLAQRLSVNRTVQLMESALVQIPTVVGWLRPVILLPASALTGLSSQQLEAILAHELAHIRRYDYLVNMLQTVVEILGFYHPAVWWISYKIRAERENCCDDLAVSISGDRIRYARALTSMEEIRAGRGELAVAASGGNLLVRIRRLVGKESADNSRVSWIPSAITILLIAVIVIPTTFALTAQNKTQHSAKSLLDKMLEHRSRVKNLQYVAEDKIWRDAATEKVRFEEQLKSMRESGIPERQLERIRQSITESPESRYQILKCTVDDAEHVKIELTSGTYDSSGKKVPTGDKFVWAWNGVVATDFHQRSVSLGGATIKDDPSIATSIAHPWMSFTGTLCNRLSKAVAAEKQIGVEELKDGTYRISLNDKLGKVVAVINPSQGYTCGLQERYKKNQLSYRETVKYEQVAKGIWFPVGGQRQEYAPDGSLSGKSTVESSQIRINDPAFNASYFDVNMPKGTTVMDEVHGKQYVVGSKRVYDLNEPQKPSTEMEEVDPNSWQEKFYSIYRLEDGQVLKRIAPPFIPERRGYFLLIQPGRYSPNTPHQLVSQYFNWDGKLSIRGARLGGGILRLSTTLESVIGLGNREYDIPTEILNADMSGDWIVRKDTPKEELLQALEQIVKDETGRDIDFVKQKVETEVIVARGKYNLRPLPGVKEKDSVHIYADKMDTYSGAGGGSGTLSKFLRWVGNRVEMNIIDETEAEGVELSWRNHYSADLSRVNLDAELYNQRRDAILNNLTRQTGLTFKREAATVEKWFIAEQESSAESLTIVPMPATSPIPSAEDKTQIRIDCLVVEVPSPLKMDRETIIMVENLLGKKITLRGPTFAAEDLLRKAAEATAAVEDETASDKRVTQDQFKTLIDMLASRGLMKILMNPTLEVVDGGTAKVQSSQKVPLDRTTMRSTESDYLETKTEYEDVTDSLEITANVLEDGNIILQVEATLALQSTPRGKEQTPLILKHKISTRARVSDGESLIIGGMKKTGKPPAVGINVKDSKEQTTETLLILTPTIVTSAAEPQDKTDSATKLKELVLTVIMYADEHDNKLPDTLQALKPYIANERDLQWVVNNVEYLGQNKSGGGSKPWSTPIAYEKTAPDEATGTNVVFLDGHVKSVTPARLRELLETELQSREQMDRQTATMQEILKTRQDYINNDIAIKALTEKATNVEMELMVARQTFAESHPEVRNKTKLLQDLRERLAELKNEVGKSFDDMMTKQNAKANQQKLLRLQAELERISAYEQQLQETPAREDLQILETEKRTESAKRLSNVGKALFTYANDHDDKYPDSLRQLRDYVNEEDLEWLAANVEYLAKGKTIAVRPNIVIAYEKTLLSEGKGTNVLFNDSHVSFEMPEKLKELGLSRATIEIETRILTVSEDFLKDIGLDANSISDTNAWPGPAPFALPGPDGLGAYSMILDDSHVDFLLKATKAHKDSKMLAAPKVIVLESEEAQIAIHSQFNYISGYSEPNRPSEEPVPKHDSIKKGIFLTLKPELTANNEKISLDFELEIRQFRGIEEHKYKGKYPYQIPQFEVVRTQIRCLVPDGKTQLIGGQKITRKTTSKSSVPVLSDVPLIGTLFSKHGTTKEQRTLLILVKPTVLSPEQAEALDLDRTGPQNRRAAPLGGYGGFDSGPPPGLGKSGYGGFGGFGPIPPAEANDAEKVDSQDFVETSAGRRP